MKNYSTWFLALATLVSTSAATAVLDRRATLAECLDSHKVPVFGQGTANFTQAIKPFNLRVPFTPASYAVPSTIQHVQDAIACGAASGVHVTGKCGGHNYASHGLGGENGHLVVDMRRFNSVTVDLNTHTAVVGAGGRIGNIALALYAQGKQGISHGTCPGVGISGLTLHGGYGLSTRKHGLALDNVISMTVVLANGNVVTASKTENPDLYWALLGAGGAFALVVDFKFKTFDAPEENVNFSYNLTPNNTQQLADMLSVLQEFSIHDQPAELDMRLFVPKQLTGVYHGSRANFDKVMAPLLSKLNVPAGSGTVSTKGWIDTLTAFAFGPLQQAEIYDTHENFYAKSLMTPALSHDALTALADYYFTTASKITGRFWYLLIDLHGGASSAVSAVPNTATAYAHRNAIFKMQFYDRIFPDNATYPPENMSFLGNWVANIEKASGGQKFGMYINYADTILTNAEAHTRYWGENYPRLASLKSTYDPKKLFEGPQIVGS